MRNHFSRLGVAWIASLLAGLLCACATQGGRAPSATPTPTPKGPPPPAAMVPDQPYVGTPRPVERPYLDILQLKESGASEAALLERIRSRNVLYSLSTFEIQKLRAAGVSEAIIEAMLASGRQSRTPTPTPRSF